MSLEQPKIYSLTREEEKLFGLDQVELPDDLFGDDTEVLDLNTDEIKYGIHLRNINFALVYEESKRSKVKKPKYIKYKDRLLVDDKPIKDKYGDLKVRCKKCKQHFYPTHNQIMIRVTSLEKGVGEGNFYCSEECKNSCPLYRTNSDDIIKELSGKSKRDTYYLSQVRELALERAGHCCEICGATAEDTGVPLHAHHIESYPLNPMIGYDLDNIIVLCSGKGGCHMKYGHPSDDDRCSLNALREQNAECNRKAVLS